MLVRLPPRFWVLRSLRSTFPRCHAHRFAWTYFVPGKRAQKKVSAWAEHIEGKLRAQARDEEQFHRDEEWDAAAPYQMPRR